MTTTNTSLIKITLPQNNEQVFLDRAKAYQFALDYIKVLFADEVKIPVSKEIIQDISVDPDACLKVLETREKKLNILALIGALSVIFMVLSAGGYLLGLSLSKSLLSLTVSLGCLIVALRYAVIHLTTTPTLVDKIVGKLWKPVKETAIKHGLVENFALALCRDPSKYVKDFDLNNGKEITQCLQNELSLLLDRILKIAVGYEGKQMNRDEDKELKAQRQRFCQLYELGKAVGLNVSRWGLYYVNYSPPDNK